MINLALHFDPSNKLELPTFILATRSGKKLGMLNNVQEVTFKNSCDAAPEMALKVYKNLTQLWDEINMFKLIYVPEADTYFSIESETFEGSDGIYKALTLTRLAEAELGQINVYGLQINTEAAIILPDYDSNFPVVLYRNPLDVSRYDEIWESNEKYTVIDPTTEQPDPVATLELRSNILKNSSLLHKLISFAPHYSIGTVDETVRDIQRIFEFNGQSVEECFRSVAEEESLIFDYECGDTYQRVINVYDALSNCNDCGYRGAYTETCPKCGGHNISEGFGENTGILVSMETLGNNLTIKRNSDAIANCYHITAGDELMTDAVHLCNPNGGYIWSFSEEMRDEMSDSLHTALDTYEALYDYYLDECEFDLSALPISQYNAIIEKYTALDSDLKIQPIDTITGYSQLIHAYYDSIDLGEFLNHSLMPSITNNGKTAGEVIAGLTEEVLSPVSVPSTENLTLAQASSAVLGLAKIKSDTLYNIQVVSQDLLSTEGVYTWVGTLSATNFYDKDDTAKTDTLRIVINDDLEAYAQSSVMQSLLNKSKGNSAIIGMYTMTDEELEEALTYYSYQSLQGINQCFVKAVEVLTGIGADDPESDAHEVYLTTKLKLAIVTAELGVRESEVQLVDFKDSETCMTTLLWSMIVDVMNLMKLQNNLTAEQWIELNSFRREADFSNDNYISTSFRRKFSYTDSKFVSDSLSNAELIKRAYEFLLQAEYKIQENNSYSYSIDTTLQNLLVLKEFTSLRDSFQVGNWIRIADSNNTLYKLRLLDYEINYNNLEDLTVSFSDISLNSKTVNQMRKLLLETQELVDQFGFTTHQQASDLVQTGTGLTGDFGYSDSFVEGTGSQTVEILGDKVTTKFNIIDGLIQGKISAADAMSLIAQELNKITLQVNNGTKTSSITITYDGVDISTSGNITLGGTVIFTDDLTDGETVISGDNIMTGQIVSANYEFTTGQTFSDTGSLFDLINGNIRTPGLYSDGSSGDVFVKGTIFANAGRIGDFTLTNIDDDNFALDHSHTAWKLKSEPIAGQNGKRYYLSLTKNRNLVVTNSRDRGHWADTDATVECNMGMAKYPWRYGYFNRLYMDGALLGIEYFKLTLASADWNSTTHRQTKSVLGITADKGDDTKIKQYIEIQPSFNVPDSEASNDDVVNNVVAFYNANIVCVSKKKNKLVFEYLGDAPSQDIDVYIYAQYARPRQLELDSPFNCLVYYDRGERLAKISWTDPNDEMFAVWDSTVLVRKAGSPPTSYDDPDATIIDMYDIASGPGGASQKNKYADTPCEDEDVADLTPGIYYYGIFVITSEGHVSSYIDSINTNIIPIITDISYTSCMFEMFTGFYSSIALVYKEGSAPETQSDGITCGLITNKLYEKTTSEVMTLQNLPVGELYFKVFAVSDEGSLESEPVTLTVMKEYDFDYTGDEQEFVVPETGIYRIETWGAQGEGVGTVNGGYGGYSVVEVELQKDEVLYINVGGQDGYNGGGQ